MKWRSVLPYGPMRLGRTLLSPVFTLYHVVVVFVCEGGQQEGGRWSPGLLCAAVNSIRAAAADITDRFNWEQETDTDECRVVDAQHRRQSTDLYAGLLHQAHT